MSRNAPLTLRALKGAAAALGVGALVYLAGGLIVSWRLNRFPPRMRNPFTFSPWELQVPAETVLLTARDGAELGAWFMPPPEAASPVVVALHGYRRDRSEVLGIGSYLWRRGYGVLVFDFRGRGGNARHRISMGAWEVQDLAAALEWLRRARPEAPVGLIGYSMGAAVALMEAGRHPQVRAIVADSAYATQAGIISYGVQRLIRMRGDFMVPAAALFHRSTRRPRFADIAPIAHAAEWRGKGLFFIGSEADAIVSPADTRRLFEAAPEPKLLWMVRGAPHCGAYFMDRERYARLVGQFFDRYLREAVAEPAPGGAGIEPEADPFVVW